MYPSLPKASANLLYPQARKKPRKKDGGSFGDEDEMDIYIIISLVILILIGVIASLLQMISPILGFLSVLIGPFFGALVGVYLGFKINDEHRRELEEEKRLFFRNLLMQEAKKSIKLLDGTVNLIPVDAWNSVVNSGDIALFKGNAKYLGDTYFQVQNYNYEAKRVRDAMEEVHLHPTTTDRDHASRLKKNFDEVTKPETLRLLNDLERWTTHCELNASIGKLTLKSEGKSTPIDKNSNIIHTTKSGRDQAKHWYQFWK